MLVAWEHYNWSLEVGCTLAYLVPCILALQVP